MNWKIVVRDKYPAFIDWETFEKIQAMLRDNRAEYQHMSRGIPRDGAALLHGITNCGECGHKMTVRYKRRQHNMSAIISKSSAALRNVRICAPPQPDRR